MDKGMFTELMEASSDEERTPRGKSREETKNSSPPGDLLPGNLEDLSEAGYTAHTYRFTDAEMRWLRWFCLRASEQLDKKITHNSLIRTLMRLASNEWASKPSKNRLRDLLSRLKD